MVIVTEQGYADLRGFLTKKSAQSVSSKTARTRTIVMRSWTTFKEPAPHLPARRRICLMKRSPGTAVLKNRQHEIAAYACCLGKTTLKAVPPSARTSARTLPPCSRAISRTSASPRPTPPICRLLDLSTMKERFKDALHAIRRNPASGVGNLQNHIFICLLHRDEDRTARLVVFDGIFDQIKQQAINQRVTADHADFLTVLPERNLVFPARAVRGLSKFPPQAERAGSHPFSIRTADCSSTARYGQVRSTDPAAPSEKQPSAWFPHLRPRVPRKSSSFVCIRASGVRSSCAAFPAN